MPQSPGTSICGAAIAAARYCVCGLYQASTDRSCGFPRQSFGTVHAEVTLKP